MKAIHFSNMLSIAATTAAAGVVVVVIIVALQLTQFRVKLHSLWSFQSVAFTDCRIHDEYESYFVAINNFAFAIQKGARFSTNPIANAKAQASKAYGNGMILSSAINQQRLATALAASVTDITISTINRHFTLDAFIVELQNRIMRLVGIFQDFSTLESSAKLLHISSNLMPS